jgi:hypothetical protein
MEVWKCEREPVSRSCNRISLGCIMRFVNITNNIHRPTGRSKRLSRIVPVRSHRYVRTMRNLDPDPVSWVRAIVQAFRSKNH